MANIKAVQSGIITMGAGATSVVDTIPVAVVLANTFLVFSFSSPSSQNPSEQLCRGRINSTTEVTFNRDSSATAFDIHWQVIEFSSGVSVQRGTLTMAASTEDQAITAVDLSKSFVIMSYENGGSTLGEDDLVLAELTTTTNLQFRNQGSGPIINWQVIEYTGATVQSGTALIANLGTVITDAITAVDLDKSWLVFTYSFTSGQPTTNLSDKMIRGRFTSTTELTFDRDIAGEEIEVSWFVIEHTDNATVQHGEESFSTVQTLKDITLSPQIDLGRSMAIFGGGFGYRGGKTNYNTDDNMEPGTIRATFTDAASLDIERNFAGGATLDVAWFVVCFNVAGTSTMCTFGSLFFGVSSGVGAGVYGTFVQMVANPICDTKWLIVNVQTGRTNITQIDIGNFSGLPGVIYSGLMWSGATSAGVQCSPFIISIPLFLAQGSGLSVRIKDSNPLVVGYGVQAFLSDAPFIRAPVTQIQSSPGFYQLPEVTSTGPESNALPHVFGPFFELLPSLNFDAKYAAFQFGRTDVSGGGSEFLDVSFQVATGPVGVEFVQMDDIGMGVFQIGAGKVRHTGYDLPVRFNSGDRLSMRVKQNLAGARKFTAGVTLFG